MIMGSAFGCFEGAWGYKPIAARARLARDFTVLVVVSKDSTVSRVQNPAISRHRHRKYCVSCLHRQLPTRASLFLLHELLKLRFRFHVHYLKRYTPVFRLGRTFGGCKLGCAVLHRPGQQYLCRSLSKSGGDSRNNGIFERPGPHPVT
jgi:hypothetical protein